LEQKSQSRGQSPGEGEGGASFVFKGRGCFSLAWGGKVGEQGKERLWLVAEGEEAKGYGCERDGLVRGELPKNGKGDWAAAPLGRDGFRVLSLGFFFFVFHSIV